ncbi:MAG: phosphatase PAP2 family protein, partial [Pseudomonadota bacterium]
VRESLYMFEMISRVGFTMEGEVARLWHLEADANGAGTPSTSYKPLLNMSRMTPDGFKDQTAYIEQYADLRQDRALEIETQLDLPTAFFGSIAYLNASRTKYTYELILAALKLANFTEMRLKHALAARRPVEYSPQLQSIISNPLHGSLPSGHATEAHIVATVLTRVLEASGNDVYDLEGWRAQFFRLAARIAVNRTVAGVHFPVDSAAGACLGITLGDYLVARASKANKYAAWEFDGAGFTGDFEPETMYDIPNSRQQNSLAHTKLGSETIDGSDQSPILSHVWDEAVKEWA